MSNLERLAVLLKDHNYSTSGFDESIEKYFPIELENTTKDGKKTVHEFEVIVENQRGVKLLGIPLFSGKSLLPLLDPPRFQRLNGVKISLPHEAMANYPLPGIDWHWSWPQWYALMLDNVDEQGWEYLKYWKLCTHWHGKFKIGDSVRRRLWVRRRHRVIDPEE